MRNNRIMWGLVCVVAILTLGLLGGCGEQIDTADAPPVNIDDDPDFIDDAPPAEIPDDAETLADVMGTFTMPSSFRMTVEHDGETQEMAMAMDGGQAAKMRAEHEGLEGAEVFIMDFTGGQMISYNTETKEGVRLPITEEEAAEAPQPWEEYDETLRIVGSEEIDGVDCWIVEAIDEDARAWIGKEDGLMRKVVEDDETTTFTITDLNAVPDSLFEVPGDVEISEIPMGGPMP